MATAIDLPKFYSQARIQFAVRHKTSGQLLGYALLLPGVHTEDSLVKLVPWHDDDLHTTDAALAVGQDKSPFSHSRLTNLNQNLNLSSASEESSMNNTLTSQCASDLPASQAEFNASVSLAKLSTSTPEQMPCLSTSLTSMSSAVSSGFSPPARSVTISKIGLSVISSPFPTVPTVSLSSVREDNNVDKCSGMQEGNAIKCSVPKRKNSDSCEIEKDSMNDSDSDCNPKTIKLDENENPKVECGDNFLPGAVRRYDVFIEDINPELKLKDNKKVRCLLCGDGKVMTYGNMGRHIKRFHEPPVVCEICHKEFNVIQIEEHMARWHKEEDIEKSSDIRKSDVNKLDLKPRKELVSPLMPPLKSSTQVIKNSNTPMQAGSAHILPVKLDQSRSLAPSDGSSFDSLLQPSSHGQANLLAGDYVALTMTSASDKGVFLKMGLDKGVRVKKAMKIFGKKFNTEYRSLKFFLGNTELTGGEVVADLECSEISVFGDLFN